MCSFVGGYFPQYNDSNSLSLLNSQFNKLLKDILNTKGGDNYGIHFFLKSDNYKVKVEIYENNWEDFEREISNNIHLFSHKLFAYMAFSRLTPEMEKQNSIPQPYFNKINQASVAIHGTIPGVDAKKYNTDTDIALDFFHYDLIKEVEGLNGKISMLTYIPSSDKFCCYHNGLGLYKNKLVVGNGTFDYYSNIDLGNSETFPAGYLYNLSKNIIPSPNFGRLAAVYEYDDKFDYNINIGCLYSGGLDALCSIQKQIVLELDNLYGKNSVMLLNNRIKNNQQIKINFRVQLFYLDWGTRANKQEIHSVEKVIKPLSEFIKNYFDKNFNTLDRIDAIFDYSCGYEYFNVKPMFTNILETVGIKNVRLTDKKASGKGLKEAEEAISYVPYRNTFMLNLVAAILEERFPNQENIIVIGANLTEGMVYLDNSENFITQINKSIKLGGQKTMYTRVAAPYMNVTKTKMIEDIKSIDGHLDLDLSFSCYFPKENGDACGKCGSCLLRKNAILRN